MARSVKMTVNNNTGKKLMSSSTNTEHGKFAKDKAPPPIIEASGSWTCETVKSGSIGPKGTVTYEVVDTKAKIEFFYDHPVGHSTSSYRVTVTPSDALGYDIKGSFSGHDQDITFELYPLS